MVYSMTGIQGSVRSWCNAERSDSQDPDFSGYPPKLSAMATAFSIALALFTVSWYSPSGVESFTQPPPAWT